MMLELSNRMALIQRVSFLLLKEECSKEDYIPKVVSIGPFHHGKKELSLVQAFKLKAKDLFVLGGNQEESFYYKKVFEVIGDVRKYYDEESTKDYNDINLARMMLLDACFIIIQMDPFYSADMVQHLGWLIKNTVLRDLFLLENQIPFCIIKLLTELRYGKDEAQNLINRFLNVTIYGEYELKIGGKEEEPLHLLDAFRLLVELANSTITSSAKADSSCCSRLLSSIYKIIKADDTSPSSSTDLESLTNPAEYSSCWSRLLSIMHIYKRTTKANDDIHSFRSATDLKAKGIHFRPAESLRDVKFTFKFLYSQLQLPVLSVSTYTKVLFLNMIAYEYSPNTLSYGEVTTYIDFMKSLIERPEDVKELREKKIFINTLGSDENVFNMFNQINTYDGFDIKFFQDMKDKIQSHYNSKRKMWMAELIHTYFRTPLTVITFLAAFILLCLSFIQTYYTVQPQSDKSK